MNETTPLNVVIDDERTFDTDEDCIYLRTADEAIVHLARYISRCDHEPHGAVRPIVLWFDHDLGEGGDGVEVARVLESICDDWMKGRIVGIKVHSMNPVGAENLVKQLYWVARTQLGLKGVDRVPLPNLVAE